MIYEKCIFYGYLIVIFIISIFSFCLYKLDKKYSMQNTGRISEKKLLFSVVLGGAFGAFMARIVFHHKTHKRYFSFIIYLSLLSEIVTLLLLYLNAYGVII
ncbi:MAG: DUF1294 domain-containing protein [Anaeroplasma sp.]